MKTLKFASEINWPLNENKNLITGLGVSAAVFELKRTIWPDFFAYSPQGILGKKHKKLQYLFNSTKEMKWKLLFFYIPMANDDKAKLSETIFYSTGSLPWFDGNFFNTCFRDSYGIFFSFICFQVAKTNQENV